MKRLMAMVLVGVGLSFTLPRPGAGQAPETAQDLFHTGQDCYGRRDYVGAVDYFTRAIEKDPKFVMAWLQRAWSYIKQGDPAWLDRAPADLAKVIELSPANTEVYFARGVYNHHQADQSSRAGNAAKTAEYLDKALADLTRALEGSSGSPDILRAIGRVRLGRGELDQGLAIILELFNRAPAEFGNSNALEAACLVFARQNRDLDLGTSAEAWQRAGTFYLEKKLYAQAVRCYSRAIDHGRANTDVFRRRSQAYAGLGDLDRAIADATKCIELNASEFTYAGRADLYAKAGDYEKALSDIDRAIRSEKKKKGSLVSHDGLGYLGKLYWRRGDIYFRKKDWDNAIGDYRLVDKNLSPGPDKQVICLQLAEAYEQKGDAANAQKYKDLYKTVGPPKR